MNEENCEFCKQTITFLGYEVDKDGIRPPKARIDALQNLKQPRDKKDWYGTLECLSSINGVFQIMLNLWNR